MKKIRTVLPEKKVLSRGESQLELLQRQRRMKVAQIDQTMRKMEEVKSEESETFQELFHDRIRMTR